ncbi:neurogenic locus notch homolog protein 3-like isoform X1 [Quercus lobata]|uniref:EGF-like domain-containing protein n=1 Tax=Quercus lobata TaxID=97700 RepID=A0A7N2LPE6_QUELO|nr:neurogenic locus notch homolog protein 3-like isoform X1 [Quercus lobata]
MENFNYKIFTLISLHFLFFTFFSFNQAANSSELLDLPPPLKGIACAVIDCVQGTCKDSSSFLGFECECYPGWKAIQIGSLTFPACVIPNCSVNFQCGIGSPIPSPPVAPVSLLANDACAFVWCGDGTCVTNGTGYKCQCNDGSTNLMDKPTLACFKECYLGGDCRNLQLGSIQSSPPTLGPSGSSRNGMSPQPTPPSTSSSSRNGISNGGIGEVPNCSRSYYALTAIMLAAIFLTWV